MDVDKGGNAWVGTVIDGFYVIDMHNFSVTRTLDVPLLSYQVIQYETVFKASIATGKIIPFG